MAIKALKCEVCGGDLSKKDDGFVCDYCGTKYSVEEAQKLLVQIDGPVNVQGNVGVSGNVGIARTATVATGSVALRYVIILRLKSMLKMFLTPQVGWFISSPMLLVSDAFFVIKPFTTGFILGAIFIIGGMFAGYSVQKSKCYKCPFCDSWFWKTCISHFSPLN